MSYISSRRRFMKHAGLAIAGAQLAPWLKFVSAADLGNAIAETSAGKVRGLVVDGVKVFKGIPYGASTGGKNRFMPPRQARRVDRYPRRARLRPHRAAGRGQLGTTAAGSPAQQSEDCLVLNVYTPGLKRWTQTPGDGLAARRRLFQRLRLRPHSRWHPSRARARRRGRDHQSSAQRVRLHVSRRCDGIRLRALEQRGPARHRRLARVGARQYRRLRRRSAISSPSSVSPEAVEKSRR